MDEQQQLQNTFDTVVRHLAQQGGPSRGFSKCLYRSSDGRKCAVGCLIPDSMYTPEMEGCMARSLITRFPELEVKLGSNWAQLDPLMRLQMAHDSSPYAWRSEDGVDTRIWDFGRSFSIITELREAATAFNLNPSVIDEAFGGVA